jgi:hypothetical protein
MNRDSSQRLSNTMMLSSGEEQTLSAGEEIMDNLTTTLDARSLDASYAAASTKKLSRTAIVLLFLATCAISGELVCRFAIGLGDPPLYQTISGVDYDLQPSKTYSRFHNRFAVNRYSMRSDDFPPQKSSPDELRVLVVGDSVVYGGVLIDQSQIDTEILKRDLQQQLKRPVVVGNISAKGWGPPSELAYLKQNGTFDADVVILELSSHDYADVPTADPVVGISPDFPDKKPALALVELVETYLVPRYLHKANDPPTYLERSLANHSQSEQDIAQCRAAENEIFTLARAHRAKVALVQHLTLPELQGNYYVGYYANQSVATQAGVPHTDDSAELRAQLESGHSPYFDGDPIHLNKSGQQILAHSLQQAANLALRSN